MSVNNAIHNQMANWISPQGLQQYCAKWVITAFASTNVIMPLETLLPVFLIENIYFYSAFIRVTDWHVFLPAV